MKHDVELTNVTEILVEQLHEQVNGLHEHELVVGNIDPKNEVEPGVASVNNLEILILFRKGEAEADQGL